MLTCTCQLICGDILPNGKCLRQQCLEIAERERERSMEPVDTNIDTHRQIIKQLSEDL